jgi:hypothetical protein
LRPGVYTVSISGSGFRQKTFTDITLSLGQTSAREFVFDDTQPEITVVLTGTISGVVRNRRTGAAISNAEVTIKREGESEGQVVRTDGRGRYEKADLARDTYRVSAKAAGFRGSGEETVRLNTASKSKHFRLRPE